MSFESSRSTNSAASSDASRKRGRPTANPWSSSGARNPRKEDTNKTPAAPSGSNRPASSKSSSRTSPFPDFGSYMVVKNQKLRDQFDADASTSSLGSGGRSHDSGTSGGKGIFRGVSIFVDGYTVPSSQELRTYMLKHGGRFENYFSRQTVTHIVCSHLPDSKMKNLRSFSRGLPVVKPTWILDSVAANKLLNCSQLQPHPALDLPTTPLVLLVLARHEKIEDVLDDEAVATSMGNYMRYIVKWKGRLDSDCSWSMVDEF